MTAAISHSTPSWPAMPAAHGAASAKTARTAKVEPTDSNPGTDASALAQASKLRKPAPAPTPQAPKLDGATAVALAEQPAGGPPAPAAPPPPGAANRTHEAHAAPKAAQPDKPKADQGDDRDDHFARKHDEASQARGPDPLQPRKMAAYGAAMAWNRGAPGGNVKTSS